MDHNILNALSEITREKSIDKAVIIESLEAGLQSAARKKLGVEANIDARVDPDTGTMVIEQVKTVVVEKDKPGGVCLNVGCIPSKALLESSELYESAREHAADHGIVLADVGLDSGCGECSHKFAMSLWLVAGSVLEVVSVGAEVMHLL